VALTNLSVRLTNLLVELTNLLVGLTNLLVEASNLLVEACNLLVEASHAYREPRAARCGAILSNRGMAAVCRGTSAARGGGCGAEFSPPISTRAAPHPMKELKRLTGGRIRSGMTASTFTGDPQ
jgi:hypothetical protein